MPGTCAVGLLTRPPPPSPHLCPARLILIGIANCMDLTSSRLPALRQAGVEPLSVGFAAYRDDQVAEVLRERLRRLPGPVFDDKALVLVSKRIGSGSGDMRRALDCCKNAIKLLVDGFISALAEGAGEQEAAAR